MATIDGHYYRDVWRAVGAIRNHRMTAEYDPDNSYNDSFLLAAKQDLINNLQACRRFHRQARDWGQYHPIGNPDGWERY